MFFYAFNLCLETVSLAHFPGQEEQTKWAERSLWLLNAELVQASHGFGSHFRYTICFCLHHSLKIRPGKKKTLSVISSVNNVSDNDNIFEEMLTVERTVNLGRCHLRAELSTWKPVEALSSASHPITHIIQVPWRRVPNCFYWWQKLQPVQAQAACLKASESCMKHLSIHRELCSRLQKASSLTGRWMWYGSPMHRESFLCIRNDSVIPKEKKYRLVFMTGCGCALGSEGRRCHPIKQTQPWLDHLTRSTCRAKKGNI